MCAMRDVDFGAASLHAAAATTILLVVNSALSPTIPACQHPKLENNTLSDTGRCHHDGHNAVRYAHFRHHSCLYKVTMLHAGILNDWVGTRHAG